MLDGCRFGASGQENNGRGRQRFFSSFLMEHWNLDVPLTITTLKGE